MVLFLFVTGASAFAQDSWAEKVKWSFKIVKIDENHADIVATAKLIEHWHVYSVNHDPAKADFTGMPTSFKFKSNENYRLIGKVKEPVAPIKHEDVLGLSLIFEGTVVFKQRIEILTDKAFDIEIDYDFQVCDEKGCLFPPTQKAKARVEGFAPKSNDEVEEELTIKGKEATDKEGNKYLLHEEKWVRIPEGNSVEFYKEYLKLGGSYE